MFRIIWSNQAESDYIETLKYWIEHNRSNKYLSKLIKEVEKKGKTDFQKTLTWLYF